MHVGYQIDEQQCFCSRPNLEFVRKRRLWLSSEILSCAINFTVFTMVRH